MLTVLMSDLRLRSAVVGALAAILMFGGLVYLVGEGVITKDAGRTGLLAANLLLGPVLILLTRRPWWGLLGAIFAQPVNTLLAAVLGTTANPNLVPVMIVTGAVAAPLIFVITRIQNQISGWRTAKQLAGSGKRFVGGYGRHARGSFRPDPVQFVLAVLPGFLSVVLRAQDVMFTLRGLMFLGVWISAIAFVGVYFSRRRTPDYWVAVTDELLIIKSVFGATCIPIADVKKVSFSRLFGTSRALRVRRHNSLIEDVINLDLLQDANGLMNELERLLGSEKVKTSGRFRFRVTDKLYPSSKLKPSSDKGSWWKD